jgi:hypothetical protein
MEINNVTSITYWSHTTKLNDFNMKNLSIIFAILWIVGCSPEQCKKDDAKVVEQTLRGYYKAISDREFEKLERLSTTGLVIYEDGLIWNNDSLAQAFNGVNKLSFQLVNLDTKVDCNSARARYMTLGKFELSDTTVHRKFTESATLIKEKGNWKIEFIHSSPIK